MGANRADGAASIRTEIATAQAGELRQSGGVERVLHARESGGRGRWVQTLALNRAKMGANCCGHSRRC